MIKLYFNNVKMSIDLGVLKCLKLIDVNLNVIVKTNETSSNRTLNILIHKLYMFCVSYIFPKL